MRAHAGAARAACGDDFELVLVNDGSRDTTWALIEAKARACPNVVGVNLARNHGHQLAVTAGLSLARGERVLIIDADLQDPPELLGEMMRRMDEGTTSSTAAAARGQGEPLQARHRRHVLSHAQRDRRSRYPARTGDFRLMSRRIVERLNAMPEQDRFLRGMVAWLGGRQTELLYDRDRRHAGATGYTLGKMVRLAVDGLTSFSTAPLQLAGLMARLACMVAFVLAIYAVVGFFLGRAEPGWTSLALIVVFFSTAQLICLTIFGEYLGRIYMEGKAAAPLPGGRNRRLREGGRSGLGAGAEPMDVAEFDLVRRGVSGDSTPRISRITGEARSISPATRSMRSGGCGGRGAGPIRASSWTSARGIGASLPHLRRNVFPRPQIIASDVSAAAAWRSPAQRIPDVASFELYDGAGATGARSECRPRVRDLRLPPHRRWRARRADAAAARDAAARRGAGRLRAQPDQPRDPHIVATCPFDKNAVLIPAGKLKARLTRSRLPSRSRSTYMGFFPAPLAPCAGSSPSSAVCRSGRSITSSPNSEPAG